MEYLTLRHSDIEVSRFCMGGCPMGGYGWGETNEQDFIDAIHLALDKGVNFFDTANTYGFGQSEETLVKGIDGCRHEVVIQSKFGVRVMQDMVGRKTIYDNSPDYIRKALEGTLKRLKTDYIDIYTIHYRDGITPIEDVVEELRKLKKEGKVRCFGLSNVDNIDELKPYGAEFVSTQSEFSLACRRNEDALTKVTRELGVTPTTWGSLGQGILTGKYNKDNVNFDSSDRRSRDAYMNFRGAKLEQNLRIVDELRNMADRHNKSIASCAIRFILDYLTDSVVIAGVKNAKQLEANIEAMGWTLEEDEINKLNEISIMDRDPIQNGGDE